MGQIGPGEARPGHVTLYIYPRVAAGLARQRFVSCLTDQVPNTTIYSALTSVASCLVTRP